MGNDDILEVVIVRINQIDSNGAAILHNVIVFQMEESLILFRPCMLCTQQSLEFISTFLYDFHIITMILIHWHHLEAICIAPRRQNVIHLLLWWHCHVDLCGPVWAFFPTWNITQTITKRLRSDLYTVTRTYIMMEHMQPADFILIVNKCPFIDK